MTRLIDADALLINLDGMMAISPTGYIHGETVADMIKDAPTVELTLYGYKIEHLALIARVMQKDGVTPEEAVQIFKSVQTIAMKVIDEISGAVERAFEQLTETRGNGEDNEQKKH